MNKYEILGVVGEGAYGVVLKCKNRETNEHSFIDNNIDLILCQKKVAIKKFKETEEDETTRKNIQREVKMLKTLKHKNVVGLIEAFKRKGRIYLVFEYVEKNLLEVLEEKPSGLDPDFIRCIIYQLLKALDHCHRHEIIHRDIKPENLLVNNDGTLKLCDFGFARHMPPKQNEILTDYVATRWYRSPELLLSDPGYSFPVDTWAVACIMGELIDGQPLFPGDNEVDQLYLIQKLLGPLTPDQSEMFIKNQRYVGLKFPEIPKPETIERRYLGKISKKALNFMKTLLKMNPDDRPTIHEAMDHPLFDGIREMYVDEKQDAAPATESQNQRVPSKILDDKKQDDADERESQFDKKVSQTIHHEGNLKNGIYAKVNKENAVHGQSTNETSQKIIGKNGKATPQFQNTSIMQSTLYNYNIEKGEDASLSDAGQSQAGKRNSNHFEPPKQKVGNEQTASSVKPPKAAPSGLFKISQPVSKTFYHSITGPNQGLQVQGFKNEQKMPLSNSNMIMQSNSVGLSTSGGGLPTIGNRKYVQNDQKVPSPPQHSSKIQLGQSTNFNKMYFQSPQMQSTQYNSGGTGGMITSKLLNDINSVNKIQNLNVIYNTNTYNYNGLGASQSGIQSIKKGFTPGGGTFYKKRN